MEQRGYSTQKNLAYKQADT